MQENTLICATCGCSLVRLGITLERAAHYEYHGRALVFCCNGCLSLFKQAPKFYLELTRHTIVCPACLSEKTISFSIPYKHNNETLYFCHCPYCMELFKKNPDYYLDRLAGRTDFKGLFSDDPDACCH